MKKMNRRKILKISGAAISGSLVSGNTLAKFQGQSNKKLKILMAGAHPDDPETGCGGIIARYVAEGHEVKQLYLTRGEVGINGVKHDESAKIRTKEAHEANKKLKTNRFFLGKLMEIP